MTNITYPSPTELTTTRRSTRRRTTTTPGRRHHLTAATLHLVRAAAERLPTGRTPSDAALDAVGHLERHPR